MHRLVPAVSRQGERENEAFVHPTTRQLSPGAFTFRKALAPAVAYPPDHTAPQGDREKENGQGMGPADLWGGSAPLRSAQTGSTALGGATPSFLKTTCLLLSNCARDGQLPLDKYVLLKILGFMCPCCWKLLTCSMRMTDRVGSSTNKV